MKKYTILFKVINEADQKSTGCRKSLFLDSEPMEVGTKFIHHYHKVWCECTGCCIDDESAMQENKENQLYEAELGILEP